MSYSSQGGMEVFTIGGPDKPVVSTVKKAADWWT